MNQNICRACGTANLSEAKTCQNCHLNLPPATNAPFNQGNSNAAVDKPKSDKLFWIIGGIAGVVVIGGFLIVAVAVGMYYYTAPTTTFVGKNTNDDSNLTAKKLSGDNTEDKKDDKKSNSGDWKSTLETKHSKLGKFKLQSVSKIEEKSKMIFRESSDEAFALYSTSDKNPLEILFSVANFSTITNAKADVEAIKRKIKDAKNGKIIKESNLSDGVIISYRKNKLIGILDCKDKTCTQTTGIDGKKVSDFYKQVTDNMF